VPIQTMPGTLQAFASHQPVTDVVGTMRALALAARSLRTCGTIAWLAGVFLVCTRWRSAPTGGPAHAAPRAACLALAWRRRLTLVSD